MYQLFSKPSNLEAVFASFGTIEAVKVRCNIDLVVRRLKIPSRALLEQMLQEGISLHDIAQQPAPEQDWSLLSETVLRSHLRAAFLDEAKLFNALATLSLPQQVEIRDLFATTTSQLKLPSELLLRRMQDEGLSLEQFGIKATPVDKVERVRDKLNALHGLTQNPAVSLGEPTAHQNDMTAQASHPMSAGAMTSNADLASLKRRIQELKHQTVPDNEPANVVTLTTLQNRLKA